MSEKTRSTAERNKNFRAAFRELTAHDPMPWQEMLYERFVAGDFPSAISLPTGLGKTTVIHIWLLALAAAPTVVPRRLVYVVNRRTVVDQATREAERVRTALMSAASNGDGASQSSLRAVVDSLCSLCTCLWDTPLAISTLRGQFADNGEWRVDPARPAIVVGTVDMIGSRLLFSAYGRGFRSRPLHAALLGQDSLLVHDEAHLEPAFQSLLESIGQQQASRDFRPLNIVALTATPRSADQAFELTSRDFADKTVSRRVNAVKQLRLHSVQDDKKTRDQILDLALAHKDSGDAVLIYLRRVEDVRYIAGHLPKNAALQLTGTLRGLERDRLVHSPIFQRFLPPISRRSGDPSADGTVYLVCTSAGEVGIDISADHLVCDLTTFDSMAQRLGRVNRYGDREARIDVVHPQKFDDKSAYDSKREKTLSLLRDLKGNASPYALSMLPPEDRIEAFSPGPTVIPATDILFDSWALTSVRTGLPGQPPVADWLHGIETWQPPDAYVAWRREVDVITGALRELHSPIDLLEDYPLKPHELLRDRASQILGEIEKIAREHPEKSAWLVRRDGTLDVLSLPELAELEENEIADAIIVLPESAGGLRDGLLDGTSPIATDVADDWFEDEPAQRRRRQRLWDADSLPTPPPGMRLVRTIDINPEADEQDDPTEKDDADGLPPPYLRYWRWYVLPRRADDDGSRFARERIELGPHLNEAEERARRLTTALGLSGQISQAVILAAKWHDLGKRRLVWQRSIGNHQYLNKPSVVLAKSGADMRPIELGGYRHEFGSLIDVLKASEPNEFANLELEIRDLVLHLIAAHHGRARPHFPLKEAFDPESSDELVRSVAAETPHRYVRLQRRYGRWGLSYLESLVRAADAMASGAGQ